MDAQIRDLVEETPFIDTHEHLIEESARVAGTLHRRLLPCDDWAYLFSSYLNDDLVNAGLPLEDEKRLLTPGVPSDEKYRLIAPYWERTRHTGYAHSVRETLRGIYGEDDLTAKSAPRIAEKYREMVKPGFYAQILRKHANIEHCHVNSLERIFVESEQPDLLRQDLSILAFSRLAPVDFNQVERETGKRPTTLDEWLAVVDQHFATYGPKAVAVKCQIAYSRALDFEPVPRERATRLFPRLIGNVRGSDHPLGPDDLKSLQDFMVRYCIAKASEYGLPVKLHTGYLAGRDGMQLARLRNNAGDLAALLRDFPAAKFVLMHIGYPYEAEFIALAKQFRNAFIDMCWAWIIDPIASVRFLKAFLLAVPANKLFTFGGDYIVVEPIYGHSRIARKGIAQAISELVAEGWIPREECPEVIDRIMRGNALEFFPKPPIA
jgi:hypothetical protein